MTTICTFGAGPYGSVIEYVTADCNKLDKDDRIFLACKGTPDDESAHRIATRFQTHLMQGSAAPITPALYNVKVKDVRAITDDEYASILKRHQEFKERNDETKTA